MKPSTAFVTFVRMGLFSSEKKNTTLLRQLADEQLVVHYSRNSDPECIAVLYERYTHLVFAVCMKYLRNEHDAEDMVMLIFEKLIRELRATNIENFRSWLFTVTRNQCLMSLRHEKAVDKYKDENLRKLESEVMESDAGTHLTEGHSSEEQMENLREAIRNLNEAQRQCIQLFYLDEKSYKEVADETGFTMNEVKSYLQNGRRNLKISLEKTMKS